MTQDQCLDNGHQAISNNHSANDQVSDDLNNSKNSIVSNGVNSVQEFNVDVNSKRSEHSADVAIVRNRAVDADSPPAGKVSTTSENSAATRSDFVNLKENPDSLVNGSDVNKSECVNNISPLPDMTVITHQNSSENIREIIANSDNVNKIPGDLKLTRVGNSSVHGEKNSLNGNGASKSGAVRRRISSSKREHKGENDKPEDPVERLNKLRASISNAISEVKGVLKQYSTEQSIDGENESAPSSQPADDGPVRFRFVRKIRRRSVFSEDDNGSQNNDSGQIKSEATCTVSNVSENRENEQTNSSTGDQKRTDEVPNISQENHATPSNDNQVAKIDIESTAKSSDSVTEIPQSTQVNTQEEKAHQEVQEISLSQKELTTQVVNKLEPETVPASVKENDRDSSQISVLNNAANLEEVKPIEAPTDAISKPISPVSEKSVVENTSSTAPTKVKTVKPKKLVKKGRRASIAEVEINQAVSDKLIPPVELKTQRRPSDSGTLVKQPARLKSKTGEKTKPPLQRQAKIVAATQTEVPVVVEATVSSSQSLKVDVKAATSEKPHDSTQAKSNLPSKTLLKPLPTDTPVKVEIASTTLKTSVAQDQINHPEEAKDQQAEKVHPESINEPPTKNAKLDDQVAKDTESQKGKETKSNQSQPAPEMSVIPAPTSATSEKPKDSTQTKLKTLAKTSPIPTLDTPVKVEAASTNLTLNAEKIIAAKVQPTQPVEAKVQHAEKILPESINAKLSNAKETKSDQSHPKSEMSVIPAPTTVTSEKPMDSAQMKLKTLVKTPTPTINTPVKVEIASSTHAVNPAKTIVTQDQPTQPVEAKLQHAENNRTEAINAKLPKAKETKSDQSQPTSETSVIPAPITSFQAGVEPEVPTSFNLPEGDVTNLLKQDSVVESMQPEEGDTSQSANQIAPEVAAAPPKKKRKAKRKVVIRRIKRKLSKEDTFIPSQEGPSELEICEKEIEEKDEESEEEAEVVPEQRKSCLKRRQFEIGDVVMYAERYRKTQVKWRKGIVIERITSISYKLDLGGEEKPAHISYIKKFTDRKVNFGGKEYLEIDYAQIEEDEEKERNYSIWNLA